MIFYLKNYKGEIIRDSKQPLKAVMCWEESRIKEEIKANPDSMKNLMVECWEDFKLIEYNSIETIFNF